MRKAEGRALLDERLKPVLYSVAWAASEMSNAARSASLTTSNCSPSVPSGVEANRLGSLQDGEPSPGRSSQ